MPSSVLMSGRLEGVLTLLPVARAQLIGLQRVEHAQHFLGAAADIQVGDVDEADHALRIDDEGGALRHARLRIEDAERTGQLALDVRQHRERELPELLLVAPPGEVHVLAVDAGAEQLRIARAKLLLEVPEGGDLGRAYEGEVLWPEEHHLPLAGKALMAERLESAVHVVGDDTGERERGKLLTNA